MVRLEESCYYNARNGANEFQFQNGTIRRKSNPCVSNTASEFQFQNGTIRRNMNCPIKTMESYFNSKMVRLEANPFATCKLAIIISIPKWYD